MRRTLIPFGIGLLLLTACGQEPQVNVGTFAARDASSLAVQFSTGKVPPNRPTPLLGVYSALYLSQGGFLKVQTAMQGVGYLMTLSKPLDPESLDDAYLLLQEFGSVLQVDVPDMLNQQTDRPAALNEYIEGLQNITLRAQTKAQEIESAIDARRTTQREQQRTLSDVQTRIRNALDEQDYATAGALQQDANDARAALAETESAVTQLNSLLDVYQDLLQLAEERINAINQNREALIAGLQVVNVPGIDDLNLIKEEDWDSDTGGGGWDFGLEGL